MLYVWLMVASVWAGLASPLGLQPAPDWVLEDEQVPPPARRITPKSVFVAPTFSECGPGYRHDPVAGRCVRIVKVNQKAQWDFFLSRLNAMYAQPTKQKAQSGPLHVALPLDPVTPPPPSTTQTVPPTTNTTPPPSTTTNSPTTTEMSSTSTTTSVPETTTTYPQTTVPSTQPTTTARSATAVQPSTHEPTTATTDLPPTTTTTFPSTPPTTYFTDPSIDTTFSFSTTDSSTIDFTETSTYSTFSTDTTETFTEFSTYPDPIAIPSDRQHVAVKLKRKCPPSVRRLGEYGVDCETRTSRPQIKFPSPTYAPRRKGTYVRFPDRTWQSSYWWPQSSWEQRRVSQPSSYQKVQHYPSWQRGRPTWADTPSITV